MKLLLQLADDFVTKGNIHASSILEWCSMVDKRYKVFSQRMEKYRLQLQTKLGMAPQEVSAILEKTGEEREGGCTVP